VAFLHFQLLHLRQLSQFCFTFSFQISVQVTSAFSHISYSHRPTCYSKEMAIIGLLQSSMVGIIFCPCGRINDVHVCYFPSIMDGKIKWCERYLRPQWVQHSTRTKQFGELTQFTELGLFMVSVGTEFLATLKVSKNICIVHNIKLQCTAISRP